MRSLLLLVIALAACGRAPSVAVCSGDADCASPRLCVAYPEGRRCEIVSRRAQIVVDRASAPAAAGFFPRAETSNVPVSLIVAGLPAESAALVFAARTFLPTAVTTDATGASHAEFLVPSTIQTAGAEGLIPFVAIVRDPSGAARELARGNLPVDDAGPELTAFGLDTSVNAPDATVNGVPWFNQVNPTPIDVKVILRDAGSGVDRASLRLEDPVSGARLDLPNAVTREPSSDSYHLFVPRAGGPVASGAQALVRARIVASDALGHPWRAPAGAALGQGELTFGIDGQPPAAPTVELNYPADGAGCAVDTVCGHDGSHFWRRGDDAIRARIVATDGTNPAGSGLAPATTWTCGAGCAVDANGTFPVRPSALALTSADRPGTTNDDGEGIATLRVGVRDAVGNVSASGPIPVNVTRVKWVRQLGPALANIQGSPIVTPSPTKIIVAGAGGAANSIAMLDSTGRDVARGGPNLGQIANSMAYSPRSHRLYVTRDGSQTALAYTVTEDSIDLRLSCALARTDQFRGPLIGSLSGPPAIIGTTADNERMLVADSGTSAVWALAAGTGTSCDPDKTSYVPQGDSVVTAPSTTGTEVWSSNVNRGSARVGFLFYEADRLQQAGLLYDSGGPAVGPLAITSSDFYGVGNAFQGLSRQGGSRLWTAPGAGSMSGPLASGPVLTDSLLLGVAGAVDGRLRAFNLTDGSLAWSYPASGPPLGTLSAPIVDLGSPSVAYLATGQREFLALQFDGAQATRAWGFKGLSVTARHVDVRLNQLATQATLAPDGSVAFASDALVYVLWSDAVPRPPLATVWPRVGFDSCNSNNSSYTDCF